MSDTTDTRRYGRRNAIAVLLWFCVASVGIEFVIFPILDIFTTRPEPRDGSDFIPILLAALGAQASHTYEKTKAKP